MERRGRPGVGLGSVLKQLLFAFLDFSLPLEKPELVSGLSHSLLNLRVQKDGRSLRRSRLQQQEVLKLLLKVLLLLL